jgi:uncharacterized RDD family membrane protein YckC
MMSNFVIRRIFAKMIDAIIFFLCVALFGFTGIILGGTYILLSDTGNGFSAGKKIAGLKVVTTEGKEPSLKASAIRNAPVCLTFLSIYIPFLGVLIAFFAGSFVILETYLIWKEPDGQRLGDLIASTRVINR